MTAAVEQAHGGVHRGAQEWEWGDALVQNDSLIPTPDFVRAWRRSANLTGAELSRTMGYSRNYVGSVEQEVLPVTVTFARRFWAVVGNSELSRVVLAAMPLRFDVVDGPVRILRQPKSCECGCGTVFVPSSKRHRFVSKKHGRRRRRKMG